MVMEGVIKPDYLTEESKAELCFRKRPFKSTHGSAACHLAKMRFSLPNFDHQTFM